MSEPTAAQIRARYLRPIKVGTAFTWLAELGLLLYYGVYLSDEGSLLYKVLWTLGFCGLGMGLSLGAEDPYLHFLPSFIASIAGGWVAGWLLFSARGQLLLDRLGV